MSAGLRSGILYFPFFQLVELAFTSIDQSTRARASPTTLEFGGAPSSAADFWAVSTSACRSSAIPVHTAMTVKSRIADRPVCRPTHPFFTALEAGGSAERFVYDSRRNRRFQRPGSSKVGTAAPDEAAAVENPSAPRIARRPTSALPGCRAPTSCRPIPRLWGCRGRTVSSISRIEVHA